LFGITQTLFGVVLSVGPVMGVTWLKYELQACWWWRLFLPDRNIHPSGQA
jgi:hypothetical protein